MIRSKQEEGSVLTPDRRSTLGAVILDLKSHATFVTMDAINDLVDFNDDRFDCRKNWLAQSMRFKRSPISPKDDNEEKLETHVRSLAPDTQKEVLRRGAAGDKNLNASVSRRKKLFARYSHHINNPVINPRRPDEDNIQRYQKVENEARAIAKASIEADQDTVRFAGKGSDEKLAGFTRDVKPPSAEERRLIEEWNAKRLQRLEEYSRISARDVAKHVVTRFRRHEQEPGESRKAEKARKNDRTFLSDLAAWLPQLAAATFAVFLLVHFSRGLF